MKTLCNVKPVNLLLQNKNGYVILIRYGIKEKVFRLI